MRWMASIAFLAAASSMQANAQSAAPWPDITQAQDYTWRLASSQETTGVGGPGNESPTHPVTGLSPK